MCSGQGRRSGSDVKARRGRRGNSSRRWCGIRTRGRWREIYECGGIRVETGVRYDRIRRRAAPHPLAHGARKSAGCAMRESSRAGQEGTATYAIGARNLDGFGRAFDVSDSRCEGQGESLPGAACTTVRGCQSTSNSPRSPMYSNNGARCTGLFEARQSIVTERIDWSGQRDYGRRAL